MVMRNEVTNPFTLEEVEYFEQSAKTQSLVFQVAGWKD
ncbi:MAG: hypothetical protein CLLPBCKN_006980 [Chroococcidiopsis cubana SAG 39.79]|nr:hypothetical protein [Chroococcidiopsis cubana SAG 39.79]